MCWRTEVLGQRARSLIAWNDDGGDGYSAALEYSVPTAGDYLLIAAGSLSALGRVTAGNYELLIGLNAPDLRGGEAEPAGAPIAERVPSPASLSPAVEEASGSLTPATPRVNVRLVDIDAGETLFVFVETISGNLIPTLI